MIEKFSTRIVETERTLRDQLESKAQQKLDKDLKAKQDALESMYHQERLRYEKDLSDMKASVYQQLKEEREALAEEKRKFDAYVDSELLRKSHVGPIEEDDGSQFVKPRAASVVAAPDDRKVNQIALAAEIDLLQSDAVDNMKQKMEAEMASMKDSIFQMHVCYIYI